MIYTASPLAIFIFILFVALVLGVSFFFARKTKSAAGYYAAGGTIHWGVNGIAFAGDYLSAASFLGICGMIATVGYDGFLYSIGYLAGWVVALFVVAEPMKKLGKFTFTDALDHNMGSRAIQLTAAISTLVVSTFYLIPQMVGAGALVTPLLGLPHWAGVIMVGTIVVIIVATAGMTSTTYVQFLKGGLLIIFSTVLTVIVLMNGFKTKPQENYHNFKMIHVTQTADNQLILDKGAYKYSDETFEGNEYKIISKQDYHGMVFYKVEKDGIQNWWLLNERGGVKFLDETLSVVKKEDGAVLYNGETKEKEKFYPVGHFEKIVMDGKEVESTGSLTPFKFLATVQSSTVITYKIVKLQDGKDSVTLYYLKPVSGENIMAPGVKFKLGEKSKPIDKLNFISLMLALFLGTASLPHILIRYYTVPSPRDARKSTIIAILAIGFFYILTLFMGLGAMGSGVLDVQSDNMAAPLLAKFYGIGIFSIISAIAFATVLGTVAGLIVAAAGAVAHDFIHKFLKIQSTDEKKVFHGKMAAIVVGAIAIILGILFQGMNVSFLVGWAFSVAASANLPAIVMKLFWKKTTGTGIAISIVVGMVSALAIILLSPSMYLQYGKDPLTAPFGIDNPAIISIPLAFLALIIVSLKTQKKAKA
ncbi:MAG TPA: cation acetate symporter [Spirochaetia bacterium]|nr:MAG: cation acetate symporter [Spirochaetes bacterium GWB1_36_13]HCL55862.1 cation acetate symporter [Spirochaetia bacterium]